ncbi:MAG: putative symporter YidK [Pelotomaculum sp. PtaB.Bin104]|nr:MAG: putative symporter YidK [Pelotomaculum sp. PtaB.Bin104]
MYTLTGTHLISIVITLSVVSLAGVYAGRQVRKASDFSVGGRNAGPILITGTIAGTLVGGATTIGTAELAFKFGLSAWWFTLGAGLACLMLSLLIGRLHRDPDLATVPQFLVKTYGPIAGPVASVFSSAGIFINIVAQVLSAIALLGAMFHLNSLYAALIAVILVVCYVIFGGVMGTGIVGSVKVVLLYVSLLVTGGLAYSKAGGLSGLVQSFPPFPWFSLFGRGLTVDLAAGFSVIVGVLSTQTYWQAMFSGKDVLAAQRGALLSAVLIMPCGLAGIAVGMYMKLAFPDLPAAEALPAFVIKFLPPWFGGLVLAVLLVAVIGTAAGLALGISTMLTWDFYKKFIDIHADDYRILVVSRIILVAVIGATIIFAIGNLKTMILEWSFLSMGLRGATIFLPLLGAIFFRKYVSPAGGALALVAGPVADLAWKLFFPNGMDPLYAGLLASFLALVLGSLVFRPPRPEQPVP